MSGENAKKPGFFSGLFSHSGKDKKADSAGQASTNQQSLASGAVTSGNNIKNATKNG